MPVRLLDERQVAQLREAPLSYPFDDFRGSETPPGFRRQTHAAALARRDLDGAAGDLFHWQVQARSGLRVQTSELRLQLDTVVVLRWGLGPIALKVPCRVVAIVDEPGRRGFTYGTLPGHPEVGQESFLLEQHDDGRIVFTVTPTWRPASTLARLGGPVTAAAQKLITQRYLRALDHPGTPS